MTGGASVEGEAIDGTGMEHRGSESRGRIVVVPLARSHPHPHTTGLTVRKSSHGHQDFDNGLDEVFDLRFLRAKETTIVESLSWRRLCCGNGNERTQGRA